MSIPVEIDDLARVLADFGSAYLITVGAEGRPKAVSVEVRVGPASVLTVADCGRGSLRNAGTHPGVTLLWPPTEPRGFTLLADGTGVVDGADLRITVTGAVLHRPGRHADGPPPPASVGDRGDACRVPDATG